MNTHPPRSIALLGGWIATVCLVLFCPILLAGCAGTEVVDARRDVPAVRLPAPASVAIIIVDGSPLPRKAGRIARHREDVERVTAELKHDLGSLLAKRGLKTTGSPDRYDLTLKCTITTVRSGSEAARLLVGYGAGKALLNVTTTLTATALPARVLLSFSTRSTTGAMPGAGLGIMSAAGATGTAVHMIGPALGIPGTLRQGLAQEAQKTADRIDQQVGQFFAAQGWSGPRT